MTRRKFLKLAALGTSGVLLTQCGSSKEDITDMSAAVLPAAAGLFVDTVVVKGTVAGSVTSLLVALGFVLYEIADNYFDSLESEEPIKSEVEEAYQFMSTGGFTQRSETAFADRFSFCCFAETKNKEDACLAFLDSSRDSNEDLLMIEGPSILGLNYAAAHIIEKYGRESAIALLYPVKVKYPADGNLAKGYKSQLVYENIIGGTTRVDYTMSGDVGVITVSADTPPDADYRMYYRNQFGIDLSKLTSA